jgi:hypothetical protein
MSDYLQRFEALAKELGKHEHIEIVEFTAQRPASATDIKEVEKKLGAPLAPPIRDFYQEANGVKFHWQIKPDVSPEIAKELRKKSKDYYVGIAEYIGTPFAMINILPLKESLLKNKWRELELAQREDPVEFAGKTYDFDDFIKRLKPFDVMSEEFCMAFFLEEGSGDPPVLLLGDACSDWRNSRLTDFASYVEMLLVTRGIVEAREKIFSEPAGDSKPPLKGDAEFWKKRYTPDLFA